VNDGQHQVSRQSLSGVVRRCDPSDHIGSSTVDLLHHSQKKHKHVHHQQIALIPEYASTGTVHVSATVQSHLQGYQYLRAYTVLFYSMSVVNGKMYVVPICCM